LLKHKKGEIFLKVFLRIKKIKNQQKLIKIIKTQKRGNIFKSIFENGKN
jgi:hypothetical protein